MIGKQTKGRGFRKLLDYLESREDAKLIGGNMSGRNARELAREFKLSRQLNSDADRVVYHVSLSAAKGDFLDDEKWSEIGDRYMKEMGFDANQFVIFRHHNTDDDHIHIAASRIRMDTGLLVHDSWDYLRSEKVLRQIEQDYQLVQVQGSREKLNRTPSTGQIRRIRREQEEYELGKLEQPPGRTIKEELQQTIDRARVDNPQMPMLIMRLQQAGISVRTGFTRNGKSKGISYEKDGQAFSGTQLGAAYTFPGLQKHRGVDYQPQRDDARIEHLLNNPVERAVESQQLINAITYGGRNAIAENFAQPLTTDKPKLKDNLSAELYNYYSADLQNLLVTDRDKEIAILALLDNKPSEEVEEIIFASPAGWTTDEAKALVLIAKNQLAHLQEQPQFTLPEEDESLRRVLHYYLTQQRGITNFLVQPLQRQGLAYIDQQAQVVFIKRDLDGEKSGALVWDTARIDNRCTEYPKNSDRSPGWFHLKLGGEADDKIERVFLCDSPIDALSMAEIDRKGHSRQPPVRTMYMAVDDPNNLPFELLRNINRIGVAFNNDSQGNETSLVIQKMLPQAQRIAPPGRTWNEILIEQQQQEELEQKQRSRGFSR
ncbi:relaxase/mobilization nuclease domain-containing protein [Nostoc sp. CHAB 5784]|uniref:relaxase/mobilization nuclease domain-containing protein n=1 Tax=Nostoc mirabile TaxID=2907820 RepID=UPI001E3B7859|nr:relaxase/mobilization nuclease domain-containing protein [Nostoc mirabile]MCC5668346.1 relaxase/mobilization nuclease domain-containing protein [Nostoc mirabile CHAB5784]